MKRPQWLKGQLSKTTLILSVHVIPMWLWLMTVLFCSGDREGDGGNCCLLSAGEHTGLAAQSVTLQPSNSNSIHPSSPPCVRTHWRASIMIVGRLPFTCEDEQRVQGAPGTLIMSHAHRHSGFTQLTGLIPSSCSVGSRLLVVLLMNKLVWI